MDTIDSRLEPEPADRVLCDVICPRCTSRMEIHQPDPELADRFLATCVECKLWLVRNSKEDVLLLPPDTLDEDCGCDSDS